MYLPEDRFRAIELYFKYGKKPAAVVRELGYPTVRQLRRWIRAWQKSGENIESIKQKPRYSDEQKRAAVEHYLNHGRCLAFTCRALGYPCDVVLSRWLDELYPGRRRFISGIQNQPAPFGVEVKRLAVIDLSTRLVPARDIAQKIGVSRQVLYKWKSKLIGDEVY